MAANGRQVAGGNLDLEFLRRSNSRYRNEAGAKPFWRNRQITIVYVAKHDPITSAERTLLLVHFNGVELDLEEEVVAADVGMGDGDG